MYVTYSPDIEATYVTLSDRAITRTVEIDDLIMVDVDSDGEPVGIEFAMRPEVLTEDMYRDVIDRFPVLDRRANDRAAVMERIVAAMRSDVGRSPLSEPTSGGRIDVIACLRSDTVSAAAMQVAELGGYATVVVPLAHGLAPLVWDQRGAEPMLDICADERVHPDSELGLLVDYIKARGEGDFSFRITVGESQEAAIRERGPLLALA